MSEVVWICESCDLSFTQPVKIHKCYGFSQRRNGGDYFILIPCEGKLSPHVPQEHLRICVEALEATYKYWMALVNQHNKTGGALVGPNQNILLEGTAEIETLCDIAGDLVNEALKKIREK